MEVLYHIRPYFVGIFHQFRPWMYEYGRWPIDDSTIYHDWPTLFNDSLVHTTQMTTWCGSWLVSQVNTHFGCNLTGLDDPTQKNVQLNYRWLPMFIDVFFFLQGTRIIWWRRHKEDRQRRAAAEADGNDLWRCVGATPGIGLWCLATGGDAIHVLQVWLGPWGSFQTDSHHLIAFGDVF